MEGTTATPAPQFLLPIDWTAADLRAHLGGIPLERVRMYPPPGMATEEDVLKSKSRFSRVCELIDGVRLVWYINPATRSAKAYTAVDQITEVPPSGSLSGGEIVPGFELPLSQLFSRVQESGKP